MVKKKVDPRVRSVIESGVRNNTRSLFFLVGDHGKDQVENIHRILSTMRVKARPSVLWCYKKDLGFSTHRKKRMKEIKTAQARGLYDNERDDPFDLFISSTNIRWTYYKETEKVMGQTFGMCVLQDFEALTPNILARTIETVEGGGIVIVLIKTVQSLKQLYTMTMDVHSRFRTEAHGDVVPRFNERFILSLSDCRSCLVLDDELNILPISSKVHDIAVGSSEGGLVETKHNPELDNLKKSLINTPHIGALVDQSKTVDQARAIMTFLDAVSDKGLRSTVSLTAGRGRGKSAALGLCLSGAIAFGYANIFLTAPSPENLKTCFEFIVLGLKALNYTEHTDFEVVSEQVGDVGRLVTRINIFRAHRQVIQYFLPSEHNKLAQAELVAIDEAAAIPLPVVKQLLGPYVVFMASTVNGYEGTGRALSLKLLSQLRQQQGQQIQQAAAQASDNISGSKHGKKGERKLHEERWKVAAETARNMTSKARALTEITLNEPIRYGKDDPVEKWMNRLLCLDSSESIRFGGAMPAPRDCELFIVDRDALFSYHPLAEDLLHRIWSLYTAAHYKNAPNDLQMLSDAPAHRLFVLLGPRRAGSTALPDVLCVLQVAFEGKISQQSVQAELSRGNKASGDLIPWTISQQFNDSRFAQLSGARVVRVATHPDLQSMGYGSRALDLLTAYFEGKISTESLVNTQQSFGGESSATTVQRVDPLRKGKDSAEGALQEEEIAPRTVLPPLLTPIADRPCERLHWLGASFGLTQSLLSFWGRKGFEVCYLRQTASDVTGEHSAIVLRELDCSDIVRHVPGTPVGGWLQALSADYRHRLVSLMSFAFSKLSATLSLALLDPQKRLTSTNAASSAAAANDDDAAVVDAGAVVEGQLTAELLLRAYLSHHDLQRLELYARNLVDHHVILDLLPQLSRLFFFGQLPSMRLSYLQAAILLASGLQHKDVDAVSAELNLPANQVLAFFNKSVRKVASVLRGIVETEEGKALVSKEATLRIEYQTAQRMQPLKQSLAAVQAQDEADYQQQRKQQQQLLLAEEELSSHAMKLDEAALLHQVGSSVDGVAGIVSVARDRETVRAEEEEKERRKQSKKHKKDHGEDAGEQHQKKKHKK